jgi:DNA-binding NarL/FixJ family response regulator
MRVESRRGVNAILYPELAKKVSCVGRREEVLRYIWAGMGTKEIGAELGISPKTVEYHRAQLYRVFGVQDPVSLCRRAIEAGLIILDGAKAGAGRERPRKGAGAHGA